ncbi:MAG: FAD-dependent oxidoreductase [Desulfuromonadales bacterium]|nr:FAD-dependent oxidoreductase [Desulfuromonadales bacterium]NIR34155.1 FAD-dependent oxidoreductase [Desulfuromonadales bacterium]NIS41604.1 FAD-dependent oxidoreductase [Desulfuromonadales bacterium]
MTRRGHRVTLISLAPSHYYSGMGPGVLGRFYSPAEARFDIARLAADGGGEFVRGRVSRIEPDHRQVILADGRRIGYDVLSCNTGSGIAHQVETDGDNGDVYPVKPIDNLVRLRQEIEQGGAVRRWRLFVAGGGPAGVEVAGNLQRLMARVGAEADITLVAGDELLSSFPPKVRRIARDSLEGRGIAVLEGVHAKRLAGGRARLDNGSEVAFDAACLAVGVQPSPLFRDSGLPTGADGGLLVDATLRSTAWPEIFGGGDCICFRDRSLAKVGVHAVRQNPILFHNVMAALEGQPLKTYEPQSHYLLIFNLGDGTGLLHWRGWAWRSRLAFWLKSAIDKRFMKTYQVFEETDNRN